MTEHITLEIIKARQNQLAEMIAKFETQTKTDYVIPEATIVLHAGERYAGIILDEEGNPAYHLILLSGEKEDSVWEDAVEWAAEQGGELPTRSEQALLLANLGDQFAMRYYWASERHDEYPESVWCQHFGGGIRNLTRENNELRARAVRRVPFGDVR